MKKIIYILTLTIVLSGCAAEKRLARFITRHPELHYVDTIIIRDTIIRPEEKASTNLTLSDLVAMDSIVTAALKSSTSLDSSPSKSISIASSRSSAALQAKGGGKFELSSSAPPDTIFLTDTITQDHFITEYKDREVIVYKQRWWQQGLTWAGVLAIIYVILHILIALIGRKI